MEQINDLIDTAGWDLRQLNEQIKKIIEIKKKTLDAASGSAALVEGADMTKSIKNLEKIGESLDKGISEVAKLAPEVKALGEGEKLSPADSQKVLAAGSIGFAA